MDDIGKLRTGSAGCHTGDFIEVYVICDFDLAGMHFQDFFSSFQVGKLYRHPSVKTSGT